MKNIRKTLIGAALATVFLPNVATAGFLNNWKIDLDGAGGTAPVSVNEFIDLTGISYVKNTFTGPGTFNFTDNGTFVSNTHDGGVGYTGFVGAREFTGVLSGATGTGSFAGGINFTGGTLKMYSDTALDFATAAGSVGANTYGANNGTLIGTFTLIGGGGAIDPVTAIPNGFISLAFKADSLLAGYWFDSTGTDLSTIAGLIPPLLFGFTTTNASYVANPTQLVKDEIVGELAGGTVGYTNAPPNDFVVSNNGQYRLSVPEPGTVALMGLGLLAFGLSGARRFRNIF